MGKTLKFSGYSDDKFCESYVSDIEIDNFASGKPIQCKIMSGNEGLFVIGQYSLANNGCWAIAIAPLEEDVPFPNWPMRFYAMGYSTFLEIDVPADFELTFFNNGNEVKKYRNDKINCYYCIKNDVCPNAKNEYGEYNRDCGCGSFVDKENV